MLQTFAQSHYTLITYVDGLQTMSTLARCQVTSTKNNVKSPIIHTNYAEYKYNRGFHILNVMYCSSVL